MSIFEGIGLVLAGVGVAAGVAGAVQQSRALDDQADTIENLGEEERNFIVQQSNLEADLISEQGEDQAEVLQFNRDTAISNAAWERRAGDVAFNQAQKKWTRQVKSVRASFAASGARISGTTNDVIAEQVAEMELDLMNLELSTQRREALNLDQSRLFSLQEDQVIKNASRLSEARRTTGLLEADAAGTEASARASAARTGSRTAAISGFGNALSGSASLFSDAGSFVERNPTSALARAVA